MMSGVFKLELLRHFNKPFVRVFLILILFSTGLLQMGISKHRMGLKEQNEFVTSEMKKVSNYFNYHQYGGYGFWRQLDSTPLISMFHYSSALSRLTVFLESGVRFKLVNLLYGKNLFIRPPNSKLDFTWYVTMFGLLVFLPWGFFAFRNKAYLRMLKNFADMKRVFAGILLGRFFIILMIQSALFFQICIQFFLNGMPLSAKDIWGLSVFIMLSSLVWVLFTLVGAVFGTAKDWRTGALNLAIFALALFIIWPELVNIFYSNKAESELKSAYKHESQKLDLYMAFEKESYRIMSKYKTNEERVEAGKRLIEKWWKDEFSKIEQMENEMIKKSQKIVKGYHRASTLNPISFFRSTNNELSSLGYNAYIDFYIENRTIHKGFLRYYIDNKTLNNYAEKVIPYLKSEQLLTKSSSSLPHNFFSGILIFMIYISIALFVCFRRMKVFLNYSSEKQPAKHTTFNFKKGETIAIKTEKIEEIDLMATGILSGFPGNFPFQGVIDGKPVNKDNQKIIYYPAPDLFPAECPLKPLAAIAGLDKKTLPADKKVFGDLTQNEKVEFLFSLLKDCAADIYVLDRYPGYFPVDSVKKIQSEFDAKRPADSVVICLENIVVWSFERDRMVLVHLLREPCEYSIIDDGA